MLLIDTNVWLERLLDQERSDEVGQFLENTSSEDIFITDFAFHSIGLILARLRRTEILLGFVEDVFQIGNATLLHLEPEDTESLANAIEHFNLDFGDAYQYATAEKYDLTIVSFDTDFDGTERGRKSPEEILKGQS